MEFTFKNNTMKYLIFGDGEEFAVILQGWATKSELYRNITDTLSEKYTVIFPLLSGFGESDEPREPMCVSDYAEAVNALLSSLNVTRAHIFCHSYGGRVFFKLNAMENRAVEPIDVVLCDVAGVVPKKSLKTKLRIKFFKLGRKLLSTKLGAFFFPDALENLRRRQGSADYNAASPVMRQTLVKSVNEDLCHLFSNVKCPALIMWGVDDDAVPLSDAYLIEKAVADGAVIEFKASGHFPFLTEWGRFCAVLRSFLKID